MIVWVGVAWVLMGGARGLVISGAPPGWSPMGAADGGVCDDVPSRGAWRTRAQDDMHH